MTETATALDTPETTAGASGNDLLDRALAEVDTKSLPRPSTVALQFLRISQESNTNNKKLASILSVDVAITAELIRVTNSAYFGFAGQIKTISHAISILGLKDVRQLVLCLSVRSAFCSDSLYGLDTDDYWRACVWRAVSGRELGRISGCNAEESFVIGLLQDVGLPALAWLSPDRVGCWTQLLNALPSERRALERDIFGLTHEELGQWLARSWGFPQRLITVIGDHHTVDKYGQAGRAEQSADEAYKRVACVSDWIASYVTTEHKAVARDYTRELLQRVCGLGADTIDELIDRIRRGAEEMLTAFGMGPDGSEPDARSTDGLIADSAVALAEMNLDVIEANEQLQKALYERDALARRLEDEVHKAQRIQRRLMPHDTPGIRHETEKQPIDAIRGINVSARELSGDFFDYFPLRDGRLMFNLADVSGKGVDAALMMTKTSSLFRCLGKMGPELGKLLAIVNNELIETSVDGMFVTMVAGVYDPASHDVEIINAGHPPALLFHQGGKVTEIPAVAPPLGVVDQRSYDSANYNLRGSSLYLFSDGFLEARGERREMLGYKGVTKLIRSISSTPKVQRLALAVMSLGRKSGKPTDDVTMLLVEP